MEDGAGGAWIAFDDRAFVGAFRIHLGAVALLGWSILFGSLAGWLASGARAPWASPAALPGTTTGITWATACTNCGLSVCGGCQPAGAQGWVLMAAPDAADGVAWTTTAGVIEMLRGDGR